MAAEIFTQRFPVDAADIVESRYFLFASASQLGDWWQRGLKERHLQPDSGGCTNGHEGETAFDGGRLQCFKVTGGARLRWSDEKRRIYGVVVASGGDIRPAVDWWARAHGISGVRAEPDFTAIEQELADQGLADTDVP